LFPELTSRLKGFLGKFDSGPVTLDLKQNVSFDSVDVAKQARIFPQIYSTLGYGVPAWAGENVGLTEALNHSVVWACNKIISETTALLPCSLLQRKEQATRVASEHPFYAAMQNAPNPEITASSFRESLTSHYLLQGNGYAQIIRRSGTGTAIEMNMLDPGNVFPDREKNGQKRLVYNVKNGNDPEKTYVVQRGKPQEILHLRGLGWDGIRGFSVIQMGRQSIGTAIAAERNVARFYANGGRVPYVLEMPLKFKTDEDFKKFRSDWETAYSEPHRAPILDSGITYKQTGLNMEDAQMLQSRLFHIHEICRWFLVSPHLVGDLSRATFSNIEQLAMEFVKVTLYAHINRWESELWRCVLTDEEKKAGYFWKHNLNALLRADFATRMAGYSTMLQNGIASVNEVREMEDWNPTPGGDDHHIQLNMQSLPGGIPLTSQAAQLVRLGQAGTESAGTEPAERKVHAEAQPALPPVTNINVNVEAPEFPETNVNVITPPVSVFNVPAKQRKAIKRDSKGLLESIEETLEPARLEFK
jgi:HK97 family phage portal protein